MRQAARAERRARAELAAGVQLGYLAARTKEGGAALERAVAGDGEDED